MGDRWLRAQASTEFLIIVGLATLILLPTTYFFLAQSGRSSEDTRIAQIEKLGTDVVNTAETVYYYSAPSRMELTEIMPDGVKNVSITANWDQNINLFIITFHVQGKDQPIVFRSNVYINGTFAEKDYSPGKKIIVIEARKKDYKVYSYIYFR